MLKIGSRIYFIGCGRFNTWCCNLGQMTLQNVNPVCASMASCQEPWARKRDGLSCGLNGNSLPKYMSSFSSPKPVNVNLLGTSVFVDVIKLRILIKDKIILDYPGGP